MFFLKARKSVPSIKNSRVFYRVSRNLHVFGWGGRVFWWPSGWDSRLPLPWPGFNPGRGTEILQATQHDPKKKRKRKKFVWAKIAFRILGTRKVTLSLPGIGDREWRWPRAEGGWSDGLSLACPVCVGKAEAGRVVQLTPIFLFVDF